MTPGMRPGSIRGKGSGPLKPPEGPKEDDRILQRLKEKLAKQQALVALKDEQIANLKAERKADAAKASASLEKSQFECQRLRDLYTKHKGKSEWRGHVIRREHGGEDVATGDGSGDGSGDGGDDKGESGEDDASKGEVTPEAKIKKVVGPSTAGKASSARAPGMRRCMLASRVKDGITRTLPVKTPPKARKGLRSGTQSQQAYALKAKEREQEALEKEAIKAYVLHSDEEFSMDIMESLTGKYMGAVKNRLDEACWGEGSEQGEGSEGEGREEDVYAKLSRHVATNVTRAIEAHWTDERCLAIKSVMRMSDGKYQRSSS